MNSSNSPGSSSSQSKRKRNRVPLSCTICRKRKVKCDKGRPQCQQCVKTGVAHLCHYMEQTWAEEAEKELSKDSELKQLRERVKSLEETLSKVHATMGNSPISAGQQSPVLTTELVTSTTRANASINGKYDNDELDLTRQFDMLHLKNNGTVHLGATHWLAIMKGDPYLKLLWGHIFTLREKLNEWYSQKRKSNVGNNATATGTCPVINRQSQDSQCPIAQASNRMNGNGSASRKVIGKCPIDHSAMKQSSPSKYIRDTNCSDRKASPSKCPINHVKIKEENFSGLKCPVDHTQMTSDEQESADIRQKGKHPSLPSFQNLTSRCPVLQDQTPPPLSNSSDPPSKRSSIISSMSQEQASDVIAKLMPPKRIVILFLDKFFNHIYPIIPILDEHNFKLQVNQILQITNDQTTLKLSKQSDSCVLGILLIILRITWLSLPPNSCKISLGLECESLKLEPSSAATVTQAKEESLLLRYETPIETIELVRKVLIKFDEISSFANSNVNMTTVQFAIFYKLYLMSSPDKSQETSPNTFTSTGQDNETHQVLMSSIVQMAFSCGLHRDPDNFPQLNTSVGGKLNKEAMCNTERLKHIWRKTWFFIVSLDVQQSLSLGSPRLLRNLNDFSDTKLPCASKIDYVNDIKELIVVKNFTLFFQLDLCIISVLNHILNVSMARTVRKFELDQLIESLEKLRDGVTCTNDVVKELVNKGLLFTTEGTVLLDQNTECSYSLPSLNNVLSTPHLNTVDDKEKKLNLAHEVTTRALFFSKHIILGMLQYLLNYILFTHYEPLGNEDPGTRTLAKNYAQEALNFAMDGYKNCILFYNSTGANNMFNYMEVLLSPACLDVGHRALQFIVCLILRAKCGPLTGMGESPAIAGQNSNSNSNSNTSGSEDENDCQNKEPNQDTGENLTNNVNLDIGEKLADILMARMILFHKLTKQVSVKYNYATRMTKSTGFFITLLKKPSSKTKNDLAKNKNLPRLHAHPNIANMTGFFKNVPSLVLSAGGDQIRRCPVYQDAIGFLPSKVTSGTFNSIFNSSSVQTTQASSPNQQLPPLNIQYQPITFKDTSRRTSDVRGESEIIKRRKLDHKLQTYPPPTPEVKAENAQVSLPPSPNQVIGINPLEPLLPSLEKVAAVTNGKFPYSPTPSNSTNQQPAYPLTFDSPGPTSEISSINHSPDFEDFLTENSTLNGLMINPSSIVEAVGFDGYTDGDLGLQTDFLPIDNNEGLNDMAPITEFSMWD